MIKRTIEISSSGSRLSVANRQLVIERREGGKATVPVEDVGLLVVDNSAVTYTHTVFAALAEAGAAVVFCGSDHLPAGLLLPLSANTLQAERFRCQVDAPLPVKKRAWKQVVKAKLEMQSQVLDLYHGSNHGLRVMATRVRSGDTENLEAQAAQRYWRILMGTDFRRDRTGAMPNALLNYGYAVLRAGMARGLVGSGLIATLGIHHHNRYNAFCLADDMLEPYRPYVDWRVKSLIMNGWSEQELDRDAKQALLSLFNQTILIDGARSPLGLAQHATSASLAQLFAGERKDLALPSSLPIVPEGGEEEVDD